MPSKYKVQPEDIVLQLQVKVTKETTDVLQIARGRSVDRAVNRFSEKHKLNNIKKSKLMKLVSQTITSFKKS